MFVSLIVALAAEQALRPEYQHERDEQGGDDLGQRRREEDGDHAVADADDEGRDDRAAQTAQAADDDDDEGQQQRIEPHQVMRLLDRHDQNAGDGRQCRAQAQRSAE